jgi:glycosyltransferase involved in cell wall biosynthesis
MKIAFIGGRGIMGKYSGVESFYEEAGTRLVVKGHQITAYCRSYFTPGQPSYEGIRIVRLPTLRSKHLETFVHTLLSTLHACFSDFDIVHYHTLGPSLFSFIPRLFGKKTVVTVQGLDWQRRKWSWFARNVLRAGEWASVHFPNQTIVVSRTLEEYYRQRYHKSVEYIPNGTIIRSQCAGPALQRFGLGARNYVLFLGRLSPEKNCDLLIEAFERIETSMKLVFAGGSSHTDEYVSSLRSHESDKIRFLGWLAGNDLAEVLTNAALFVLPSDMEGLSLALLDAMGSGLCVLASDVPENREVIANAGFTFRRGDLAHFRQMLTRLLADVNMRDLAGQRARERVLGNYLWERVTIELERVYSEVLSAKLQIKSPSTKAHKRAA